jgi:hypothetical protein
MSNWCPDGDLQGRFNSRIDAHPNSVKSESVVKFFWEKWKKLAKRIGDFQARLILSVLYFVVVAPFALIVRFGADPLSIKPHREGWRAKVETKGSPMDRALNQF